MLRKKYVVMIAVLFLLAVFLTGEARLRLDKIKDNSTALFQDMLYLPRGKNLKLLACGFDAPLADALFIKALVYYPKVMEDLTKVREAELLGEKREATNYYVYELFDVVTELSPRFYRAYEVGAWFLTATSSVKTSLDGIKLLQKGVDHYDDLEKKGVHVDVDPRWLLHSIQATTQEVNIQSHYRAAGDAEGAAAARGEAGRQFRLAAASPDAPPFIINAASGFESVARGGGDIAESIRAVLSVWQEMYDQAKARGDKELAADMEKRIGDTEKDLNDIYQTRQLEQLLSQVGREYLKSTGHAPASLKALLKAGLLKRLPDSYPLDRDVDGETQKEKIGDTMLALPDGSFKSKRLADIETKSHLDLLLTAVIQYRRAYENKVPGSYDDLVRTRLLDKIPVPPLAALGQRYELNTRSGGSKSVMPEGPELPPER